MKGPCGGTLGSRTEVSEAPVEARCTTEAWHCITRGGGPLGAALWLPFLSEAPRESEIDRRWADC
ncbi:hypothetical protein EYF80_064042 [Liparis tanakae]|uniref:Uncharacterized protein n=1 Tax=Liparis tanakae TaxID=230148 RepID=A0A4Z2EAF5_9TELE|nr:hypothetical protein EYF80_064042 [Liparis tanakae]